MAVRLDTPERDLVLQNRQPGGVPAGAAVDEDGEAELAEFRERLDAVRAMRPPEEAACRGCWDKGRETVVALVLATPLPAGDAAQQLEDYGKRIDAARQTEPVGLHWREQWIVGRDAAIEGLEGA